MPVGNGITVRIRDANGVLLDEAGPTNDEPRGFRYRLITAEPSSYFEVIITVEKRFQWKEMETLFFAIAYDEGADEHLGSTDFTMAWAIPANGDYLGEHIFTEASKCENDRSALLKTTYSMPNAASATAKSIKQDSFRHRSKDALVSHRGCISVYVHRGHLSSNPKKRRPADPVTPSLKQTLSTISESKERRIKINFDSFEPLQSRHGNVCEFHFRNVNTADFATVMAATQAKAKAKEAGSATPISDGSATLDTAIARRSQGLRGLQQKDYSISNVYHRTGYPWYEDGQGDQQEAQEQQEEVRPLVKRRGVKRKMVRDESDDDDDEEIFVHTPRKPTKSEHFPGQAAPVDTVEDRQPVVTSADIMPNGNDDSAATKKRRKLELEMEEIELARRANALDRAAVDLDRRAHHVRYELAKLA